MTPGSPTRRYPRNLIITAVTWIGYAIIYPQLAFLAPHPGISVVIPVVATGWLCGAVAGLMAGAASMPVTMLMATVTGMGASIEVSRAVVFAAGAMLTVVGLAVGRVRDLNGQLVSEMERRETEELSLERSERRFRSLSKHNLDGVAVVVKGSIVYVNAAACRMFGYEKDELVGKAPSVFVAPHDRDRVERRILDRVVDADGSPSATYEAVRKDGTTFPLEVFSQHIEYEGEQALLSQLRDLTERRRQEMALRDAEEKYRSLVENSVAGVAVIQGDRFVYVNPKFTEIIGYTQTEVLALHSALDLILDDDRALVEESARQRLEGEVGAVHYTARVRRKDGRVIVIEVNGAVTTYLGKTAVISTLLDITERHRTEEQLRESEARFRTLFEEAPIGMVIASMDTRIQRVNAAFCQMLGYTGPELAGRSIVDLTHPDDPAGTPESAAKVFADARLGTRISKRYLRKDGTSVSAETTVSTIKDLKQDVTYAVAMVEDVTEQRELETQLERVMRLESVGQLAGGVAHNFNNALTAISGYADLLTRRFDENDPACHDLEQIQKVTEEAAKLTQQLLAFSREERLRPKRFSLNDSVQSTKELLAPLLGDSVQIDLHLGHHLPQVSSDQSQIEQVITNLILNARDAMPDGGRLTIETSAVELDLAAAHNRPDVQPGRYVRLSVTDTGTGMDEETMTRVFEPFFTTKEPGQGVGLGLAMAHGVLKQSGGFISVDSKPNAGSTFAVHLPDATSPAPTSAKPTV